MRLAKYVAGAGVASRRAAEAMVREGRISVGGEVVVDPARAVAEGERVEVDGRAILPPDERVAVMVNKPRGVVSTARDPQGRTTVVSLVDSRRRLYPVGRLDADTSGLILLTDDGELAHRLTHPSFEVEKTYQARVEGGPVRRSALQALRTGVRLQDGLTAPARVRRLGAQWLEITIHEGRNRQVRRMCEAVGYPVVELRRVRLGPLRLGDLAEGAHRRLSPGELSRLRSTGRAAG